MKSVYAIYEVYQCCEDEYGRYLLGVVLGDGITPEEAKEDAWHYLDLGILGNYADPDVEDAQDFKEAPLLGANDIEEAGKLYVRECGDDYIYDGAQHNWPRDTLVIEINERGLVKSVWNPLAPNCLREVRTLRFADSARIQPIPNPAEKRPEEGSKHAA